MTTRLCSDRDRTGEGAFKLNSVKEIEHDIET